MNINLPHIVTEYFAADQAKDSERLSRCFHGDAVVFDEGREYQGFVAIKAWHRDANARYRYVVEPLDGAVSGSRVIVRARVTGDFPGSPAPLRCTFTLVEDQIASLEFA